MIRRLLHRLIARDASVAILLCASVATVVGIAVFVAFVVGIAVFNSTAGLASAVLAGLAFVLPGLAFVTERVAVFAPARYGRVRRRSHLSGGLGRMRVSPDGNMRQLQQACKSVDRLVDYLLDQALRKLPAAAEARYAEEWRDHRQHYSGWRLLWWALCVRSTALRTVTALGPAQLPRDT